MGNIACLQDFSEYALKSEAEKAAQTITIRSYDDQGSEDIERTSTPEEAKILTNIIYGALLAMREGATTSKDDTVRTAALATAEYIGKLSIPDMNGFLSVYNPTYNILKDFDEVSARARSIESDCYFNGYNIDRTPEGNLRITHNNKTVAYEDGPFEKLKRGLIGNLANQYISGDDIRREDDERADNEPILDFLSDSRK